MIKRAAIILAGGKAKRFQTSQDKWQDKALAELNGKPFLVHAIENVQPVVDEIVIVINENQERKLQYNNILASYNMEKARIVTDIKIDHLSGPIVAILTGLKSVDADYCLTVPSDMPLLNTKVAEYLFNEIKGSYVAVPMWPNGRLETLLMVLERKTTLEVASVLCELGRSHPDDIIRGSLHTLFVSPLGKIKALDPELKSFVNINYQEDLGQLQPRKGQGSIVDNLQLDLGGTLPVEEFRHLKESAVKRKNSDFAEALRELSGCALNLEKEDSFFWAALIRENEGKSLFCLSKQQIKPELVNKTESAFLQAANNYRLEAELYEQKRCYFLAQRAKSDKAWCEAQAEGLRTN